jgi:hypothetical protein
MVQKPQYIICITEKEYLWYVESITIFLIN